MPERVLLKRLWWDVAIIERPTVGVVEVLRFRNLGSLLRRTVVRFQGPDGSCQRHMFIVVDPRDVVGAFERQGWEVVVLRLRWISDA